MKKLKYNSVMKICKINVTCTSKVGTRHIVLQGHDLFTFTNIRNKVKCSKISQFAIFA
jgi:hypothetical protein